MTTHSEEIVYLTMHSEKPLCLSRGFESAHLPLSSGLMGSFSAVVRIAVLVVYDRWLWQHRNFEFVGDHAPRFSALVLKHLLKESRSGTRILMLLHKDIDNLLDLPPAKDNTVRQVRS